MTGLYGFETADSKDTRLRLVSIVFLERLIVLRAVVPEFPIGQAAAAPCLGALNRGIWRKLTKSKKIKEKSGPGHCPGKRNPLKISENPSEASGISGKSRKSSKIFENPREFSGIPARASPEAPKSPESPEFAGAPKKWFKNDFFETYKQ